MPRPPNIVNLKDVEAKRTTRGERFDSERKALTGPAGSKKLGCSWFRVPAGKTAFPHHRHHGNEELIYVLSGTGTLRLDDARHAVGPGDYIALTAGGPAHQLIAGKDGPLEYLCVSTMLQPEVVEYPDAGKVGAIAGAAPGGDQSQRKVFRFYPADANVDYWEGE